MKSTLAVIAFAFCVSATSGARADEPYRRDIPKSLAAQAKLTEDEAVAIAQRAVPKGKVTSLELEMEHGKLIYSMDVKTAGRRGVDEVNVDAKTGMQIGAVQHESAATEKAEEAAESSTHESAKPAKKP